MRPFGTAFIFVGWDEHYGFQIYTSDPSGNLACWKAIAQGQNEENNNNHLQDNYKEDLNLADAKELAMKTIMTGLDTEAPDLNKLVLAVVDKDEETRVNEVNFKYLT